MMRGRGREGKRQWEMIGMMMMTITLKATSHSFHLSFFIAPSLSLSFSFLPLQSTYYLREWRKVQLMFWVIISGSFDDDDCSLQCSHSQNLPWELQSWFHLVLGQLQFPSNPKLKAVVVLRSGSGHSVPRIGKRRVVVHWHSGHFRSLIGAQTASFFLQEQLIQEQFQPMIAASIHTCN